MIWKKSERELPAQWPDLVKRLRVTHGQRWLRPVDSMLKQRESER
jgi:hypothetical protein